jgi:uncharacterized membrane protein YfcA
MVVAGAGLIAGAVNTIAGGGSLLSYPALLAAGLNPLAANVTNTVGLLAGQASGGHGYRAELGGQRNRIVHLALPMAVGGVLGATLLLTTPPGAFKAVVPWLIIVACLALLLQPRLLRLIGKHPGERSPAFQVGLLLGGAYGGYFGAAVGIMLLALFALFVNDSLQRLNAAKVVLSGMVNAIAAIAFALFGPVDWLYAVILGVAALVGGVVGATLGRRISARALRVGVATVGIGIAAYLIVAG